MFVLTRECNTNQKITIDLSTDNKWLVSGGSDGKVQIWNVSEQHYPTVHMQVRILGFYLFSLAVRTIFIFQLMTVWLSIGCFKCYII